MSLVPIGLRAQEPTAVVVPGARYEAGGLRSWLVGTDYRNLWTTPITVPVLNLETFAGGLTATETGGGRQTRSLRLRGADGREYAFRSVAKWPAGAADPDMAGALLGYFIQDQVSSMVPGAPVAASRISAGVGIPHAQASYFVMPDDPALGEFRETFGGMFGTIEERPGEEVPGGPAFGGFPEIISTDDMLDLLEEDASHRADVRSYLFARLLDLVLGDWDRHEDQWRWGRRDTPTGTEWIPIPRDRDYVFSDYDGAILGVVRRFVPNAVTFEHDPLPALDGLLLNARDLDHKLLAGLERPVWDSVALDLSHKLTDEVIDHGIAALPPAFQELEGLSIRSRVQVRRDRLPELASAFYARLALVPRVYATDEDEVATFFREADGSVRLTIVPVEGDAAGRTTFERTFRYPETKEVRLYLRGGDDRGVVYGGGPRGMILRLIGGGGDDVLADSATTRGRTSLHDSGDDNLLISGRSTVIDRYEYIAPDDDGTDGLVRIPTPDQGTLIEVRPLAWYSSTRGALLGVSATATRFRFRRHPYHARGEFRLRFATQWADFEAEVRGSYQPANPALLFVGEAEASRIDALRFYGFGNETPDDGPSAMYVVRREILGGRALGQYQLRPGVGVSAGVAGYYSKPWVVEGSPLESGSPLGVESFSAMGVSSELSFMRKESREDVGISHRLSIRGSAFPLTSASGSGYSILETHAGLQVPLTAAGSTRLAARAGGRYAFGDYPFFESSFLGGIETLRGFPQWRYAGDGMVYGGVEAMAPLMRLPIGFNWRTGVFAFADAGRVFLEDESSSRWHTAPGIGLSLKALTYEVRLTYAHGPKGRMYLELGTPY